MWHCSTPLSWTCLWQGITSTHTHLIKQWIATEIPNNNIQQFVTCKAMASIVFFHDQIFNSWWGCLANDSVRYFSASKECLGFSFYYSPITLQKIHIASIPFTLIDTPDKPLGSGGLIFTLVKLSVHSKKGAKHNLWNMKINLPIWSKPGHKSCSIHRYWLCKTVQKKPPRVRSLYALKSMVNDNDDRLTISVQKLNIMYRCGISLCTIQHTHTHEPAQTNIQTNVCH